MTAYVSTCVRSVRYAVCRPLNHAWRPAHLACTCTPRHLPAAAQRGPRDLPVVAAHAQPGRPLQPHVRGVGVGGALHHIAAHSLRGGCSHTHAAKRGCAGWAAYSRTRRDIRLLVRGLEAHLILLRVTLRTWGDTGLLFCTPDKAGPHACVLGTWSWTASYGRRCGYVGAAWEALGRMSVPPSGQPAVAMSFRLACASWEASWRWGTRSVSVVFGRRGGGGMVLAAQQQAVGAV